MSASDVLGRFLWYDLMTTDPQGAQQFYAKVVGWGLQPYNETGAPYKMFTRDGTPIGGSMELPAEAVKMGARPYWLSYIGTPDVDKTVELAKQLGARVFVPPADIPTVGRFSIVGDPQGAIIAFFAPFNEQPPSRVPLVGDVSWHELTAPSLDTSLSFYQQTAGWEQTASHDMGPMGVYQMFGRQGVTLGGMVGRPAGDAAPAWLYYFRVRDIAAAVDRVKGNGGTVVHGPHEVPGGDWVLVCVDPQGAPFALHERKAGA
jgi:uncharacterized protein